MKRGNKAVYEKNHIGKNGEKISIVYARSRETQESMLSIGVDKDGDPRLSSEMQQAFSTENGNPFADHGLDPSTKQTGVFIRRFFGKWSYADIAEVYGDTPHNIIKVYHNAVQRLLAVLIEMDGVSKMTDEEQKRANVAKQKRYYEKNREQIKAKRRKRYAENKASK
ncbi:MAG: hypothetical protein HGJ94_22155 [Desulfosarcina sp.]|nr:hypothetical protein [Desulfosarcina sp.]